MKRPEFEVTKLPPQLLREIPLEIWELLDTETKYEGYIRRQNEQLSAMKSAELLKIPVEIDYALVPGLRIEARQKLREIRPATIGQAARVSGVTPSDLGILRLWVIRRPTTVPVECHAASDC